MPEVGLIGTVQHGLDFLQGDPGRTVLREHPIVRQFTPELFCAGGHGCEPLRVLCLLHQVAGDRRPFGAEDVQIEEVGGVEVTIEGVVVVDHHGPSRRALPQQVGAAGGVAQLPILVANPPVEGQQIAAEVPAGAIKNQDEIIDAALSAVTLDGKLYGAPLFVESVA